MKTKQELYEEARALVNHIASLPTVFDNEKTDAVFNTANEIRSGFFNLENNTTQEPCRFAELAVHTRCMFFLNDAGQYPFEVMFNEPKKARDLTSSTQGTYHFLNESVADLKLVCEDFERRGLKYHVFWNEGENPEYVIWTPDLKYGA